MGCEVVVGGATASEAARISAFFARWDDVFSRFRPHSELSCVNRRAGSTMWVSRTFAQAVATALDVAAETGGLVDPTLGRAIEAAGYTKDFVDLVPDARPAGAPAPGRWSGVRLDGRLLFLDADLRIDLNGVVKALVVDAALALLAGGGFVSAGGDLASTRELDVGLPAGGSVRVVRGALATSGSATRRWVRGGRGQHHLIDPRTGAPAVSPWEQVTVSGSTCVAADAAAKAGFLLGEDGPDWLDERGLPGRFISTRGETHLNSSWRASVAGVSACI